MLRALAEQLTTFVVLRLYFYSTAGKTALDLNGVGSGPGWGVVHVLHGQSRVRRSVGLGVWLDGDSS